MPKDFSRTRRVGEQVKRILAELIRDEVKDPRVGMVTITGVDLSRDFSAADVYVSTLDDEHKQQMLEGLQKASGFLRRELGHHLKVRHTPQLRFHIDESMEKGFIMDQLIDEAVRSDRNKKGDEE